MMKLFEKKSSGKTEPFEKPARKESMIKYGGLAIGILVIFMIFGAASFFYEINGSLLFIALLTWGIIFESLYSRRKKNMDSQKL